ncbi:MAG: CHASE3 domain-containing protein [Bryobacteraceae bacterium]
MRMVIRAPARGGFALALAILVLIGVLSYWSNRSLVENQDAIFRGQQVINGLDELLVEVLEAESAARGFVIAGEKFFLDPYYATTQVDATVARLRTLLSDDPKQRQDLESLNRLVGEKLAFHRRMIELRRNSGEQAGLQFFLTGKGYALGNEVRDRVHALIDEQDRVLRDRTAAARRVSDRSIFTLVVGSVLSFGILLLVYMNLDREIAGRRQSEQRVLQLNRLYAVLSRTSQSTSHIRERDALFQAVCRIAVEDGLFRMAWVGRVNPHTGNVEPVAFAGFEDGYLGRIHIATTDTPEGRGPTGRALRERRHFVCSDIAGDPQLLPWRDAALARGYRSSAAFPIQFGDSVVGVFTVYAAEPGFFDDETVGVLSEAASEISFALESMDREARRHQAEEDLRSLNEDLERRVAERTSELARAASELETRNREVERANRMKTEFLARMSHELRTPLNAIVGYSDLLGEEVAGPLPPTYARFVDNIQEGARHLLYMVNDLLDLSKIEAGRVDLNREPFHPAGALEEVLSVITPLARIKNIAIENQLPPGDNINADRTRFKQILYNLLSNAVKFTPENGRVWVAGCNRENTACFWVGDTGIGIPGAELEAVFDDFHQVDAPPGAVKEGTGLGLAITKRLVNLHGGTIWAESTPDRGSCFFFSLGPGSLEPAGVAQAEM